MTLAVFDPSHALNSPSGAQELQRIELKKNIRKLCFVLQNACKGGIIIPRLIPGSGTHRSRQINYVLAFVTPSTNGEDADSPAFCSRGYC